MDEILLEKNVPCEMRDGVILKADIYRPNKKGPFPVLLTRLPYGKDDPFFSHRYLDTNRLVGAGYIVVIQDVRGRYQSEGEFYPFVDEAADGYDTVEWVATLPDSNGQVGMFGLSYYGFTQLLAAKNNPPHLKAIFPAQTLNDMRSNMIYQDNLKKVASMKTWILESMVPDLLGRKYAGDPGLYQEKMSQWAEAMDGLSRAFKYESPQVFPILEKLGIAETFFQVFDKDVDDPIFEQASIRHAYDKLNYPAVHLAGWYDSLLASTLENYEQMHAKVKAPQHLIVGPWTHGDFGSIHGEIDFGMKASEHFINGEIDLTTLHIHWFDKWLKESSSELSIDSPVKLFVMGSNEWRDEKEWPLERQEKRNFYLGPDKRLDDVLPELQTSFTNFVHNPNEPMPTIGGQTLHKGVQTTGPRNQAFLYERHDNCLFKTEVLKEAVEVTGYIKAKLWVASCARRTTFTAKLLDVYPDGRMYNLVDGIKEVRFEASQSLQEIEIEMLATSNLFKKGHRIGLEIASSNHPKIEHGVDYDLDGNAMTEVEQTIYHDISRPSHIVLPLIPLNSQ